MSEAEHGRFPYDLSHESVYQLQPRRQSLSRAAAKAPEAGPARHVWDDTQIPAGGDWLTAIERALAEAQVAILLVSADFLASDFVTKVELPKILAAARDEGVTILLVLLGHCGFRRSKLNPFQSVNDPENPLDGLPKHEQDKVWSQVAELTVNALKAKAQEWSEKARSAFEANNYAEALDACEHALQYNPDDISALKYKGVVLYFFGSDEEALNILEQAIQLDPNDAFAQKLNMRGQRTTMDENAGETCYHASGDLAR